MTNSQVFTQEDILAILENPSAREFFNHNVSSFFITILPADVSDTFEGHEFDITLVRLAPNEWIVKDRLSRFDYVGNRNGDSLFSEDKCRLSLVDAVRLAFTVAPSVFVMGMFPSQFPAWYREISRK